ncbi:hypothetical protein LINGRAHAP2_LOCUS30992 [Linum grandiflorum]
MFRRGTLRCTLGRREADI